MCLACGIAQEVSSGPLLHPISRRWLLRHKTKGFDNKVYLESRESTRIPSLFRNSSASLICSRSKHLTSFEGSTCRRTVGLALEIYEEKALRGLSKRTVLQMKVMETRETKTRGRDSRTQRRRHVFLMQADPPTSAYYLALRPQRRRSAGPLFPGRNGRSSDARRVRARAFTYG